MRRAEAVAYDGKALSSGDEWDNHTPGEWNQRVSAALFSQHAEEVEQAPFSDDHDQAQANDSSSGDEGAMTQKVMELMSRFHLTAEQTVEVACDPDLEARLLVPDDVFTCEVCRNFHGTWQQVVDHEATCDCLDIEDVW